MNSVKICIVSTSLKMLGGHSPQAAYLINGLRSTDIFTVEHLATDPSFGILYRAEKIKYVRTIIRSVLYWMNLIVRLRSFDIVHIFSAAYAQYLLVVIPAILIAKAYGKKIVLNYHSGEAEGHLAKWRRTTQITLKMVNAIVVPSNYLVDVFARYGFHATVIYNVIDIEKYHFRERSKVEPLFLTSRLLEPLYNVACVLRAFAIIQKHYPNASLIVAGEGSQRAQLEMLARDLHLRNTRFVGRVPWEEMASLYDSADIYLMSTDIDNMPNSILECFASGVPVVTTDAGGITYVLKHEKNGLLVKRNDHESLAAGAMRLLNDPALVQQISRAGHYEAKRYAWNAVKDQWVALYRNTMNPEPRASDYSSPLSQ